jgi:hypothetical protein
MCMGHAIDSTEPPFTWVVAKERRDKRLDRIQGCRAGSPAAHGGDGE